MIIIFGVKWRRTVVVPGGNWFGGGPSGIGLMVATSKDGSGPLV
jgi:hypothetical protein